MRKNKIVQDLKEKLKDAQSEIKKLGGTAAFKSGEWFLKLIQKSFSNYWEKANSDYFREKYKNKDNEYIAKKLIAVAARNASILGGIVGATISVDEIAAIVTGGEGGIGLPANITIAVSAVLSEAILLVRFQLHLVINIAKLYDIVLDPEDPEDILTIFAYAIGGKAAEEAGKFGMKVGSKFAANLVKGYIKKDVLKAIKSIGAKLGIKILQRTIIKYVVPGVSIGLGVGWNYFSTKAIGKIAVKHFKKLSEDNSND